MWRTTIFVTIFLIWTITGHGPNMGGMLAGGAAAAAAAYGAHHLVHSGGHHGYGYGGRYGYGHGKFKHGHGHGHGKFKHGKFKHGKFGKRFGFGGKFRKWKWSRLLLKIEVLCIWCCWYFNWPFNNYFRLDSLDFFYLSKWCYCYHMSVWFDDVYMTLFYNS